MPIVRLKCTVIRGEKTQVYWTFCNFDISHKMVLMNFSKETTLDRKWRHESEIILKLYIILNQYSNLISKTTIKPIIKTTFEIRNLALQYLKRHSLYFLRGVFLFGLLFCNTFRGETKIVPLIKSYTFNFIILDLELDRYCNTYLNKCYQPKHN